MTGEEVNSHLVMQCQEVAGDGHKLEDYEAVI